ncbi:substrate-binding domain-containing protein [Streptomyces sp. NPDC091281]|uniref:substrate-binding domain-containing protein n=1 Tax=Streptomyces sp. NPDC091281 TaxID=3365985 RepID=UPI00382343C1
MNRELSGLSSMATRPVLADLAAHLRDAHGVAVRFEAAGGVETARRVREGAAADLLVLASGALAKLAAEGFVVPGTVTPLWLSQVVAAVPEGAPVPVLGSAAELRAALLSAGRIAYSTGPSGTALVELIARLGLTDALRDRLVRAAPGVPVGSLLADGGAELAFQQHSELADLAGVTVVGPLPGDTAITSAFDGAVLTASAAPDRARDALALLRSGRASELAAARGMRAATADAD